MVLFDGPWIIGLTGGLASLGGGLSSIPWGAHISGGRPTYSIIGRRTVITDGNSGLVALIPLLVKQQQEGDNNGIIPSGNGISRIYTNCAAYNKNSLPHWKPLACSGRTGCGILRILIFIGHLR